MKNQKDVIVLREMTKKYMDLCNQAERVKKRDLWRRHNSFKGGRPLIYVRAFAWNEMPAAKCDSQDPLFRYHENFLRHRLFWSTLNDDSVFEPWITVPAVYRCTGWGVGINRVFSEEDGADAGGSFKIDYAIKDLDDIEKLRMPSHEIDEVATATDVARVQDAIGDLITVNVDRAPAYRMWTGDISTMLGYLRGIEHFMMDMIDNPEWLHRLVSFMSEGILKTHNQAEAAGDWGLSAHENQAMPYAEELIDPAPNVNGVKREQLWGYMAAQEFTSVSPAMHDEFVLQYQLPILKKFGLVAYGCCEDLTQKIDMLRQIPNLRRIAVSPFADVLKCAEQIGDAYILSYRPSPVDMVSYDFNPARIKNILERDLTICRGNNCHTDITLKDVETVGKDPDRIHKWVEVTRKVIDKVYG